MSAPPIARTRSYAPGLRSSRERGEARRGRHRVAVERAHLRHERARAFAARVEALHDVGAAGDGGERKAAADDLAERGQIRRDAVVLLGAAVREPEPRHDLVEDQRDAVPLRQPPETFEEALAPAG